MLTIDVRGAEEKQEWVKERAAMVALLKENLQKAHNIMKNQADKHRSERVLEVGDWVYLKVQPYKQLTVAVRSNIKLTSKCYGPFQVIERVGAVAYMLKLPPGNHTSSFPYITAQEKDWKSHYS